MEITSATIGKGVRFIVSDISGYEFTVRLDIAGKPPVMLTFIQYGETREECIRAVVGQIKMQFPKCNTVNLSVGKMRSSPNGNITPVLSSTCANNSGIRIVFEHYNIADNFSIPCPCKSIEEANEYIKEYKKLNPYKVAEFEYRYQQPRYGFYQLTDVVNLVD